MIFSAIPHKVYKNRFLPSVAQSDVRKQSRVARRALSREQQREAAINLARTLAGHTLYLKSSRIAFYLPHDGEIDPTAVMISALSVGKACYLPVLYRGGENRLLFGRVKPSSRFTPNRFGIPEPDIAEYGWAYAQHLDLILAPLVAFDDQGNRIGMGGGYYDNSLKYLKRTRHWKKPRILGLAHECQRVASINRNAWDVPLHGAVTDRRIYNFNYNGTSSCNTG